MLLYRRNFDIGAFILDIGMSELEETSQYLRFVCFDIEETSKWGTICVSDIEVSLTWMPFVPVCGLQSKYHIQLKDL
jgi:hypothetical protein